MHVKKVKRKELYSKYNLKVSDDSVKHQKHWLFGF
jgi:hypothetical protein